MDVVVRVSPHDVHESVFICQQSMCVTLLSFHTFLTWKFIYDSRYFVVYVRQCIRTGLGSKVVSDASSLTKRAHEEELDVFEVSNLHLKCSGST